MSLLNLKSNMGRRNVEVTVCEPDTADEARVWLRDFADQCGVMTAETGINRFDEGHTIKISNVAFWLERF